MTKPPHKSLRLRLLGFLRLMWLVRFHFQVVEPSCGTKMSNNR